MALKVFLSYSRQNIEAMRRVRDDLSGIGITVWSDEKIHRGQWQKLIEEAIDTSDYMVVILSPDAKQSEWVNKELDYARLQQKPILPLMAAGDDRTAVPFLLSGMQYFDIRQDYGQGITQLLAALQTPPANDDEVDTVEVLRPVPDASQPSASISRKLSTSTLSAIDPWNLFDQVQFLRLLLWQPSVFTGYRSAADQQIIHKTATWLISGMCWFPLLLPILGITLGSIQIENAPSGFNVYLLGAGVVGLIGWSATPFLSRADTQVNGLSLILFSMLLAFVLFTAVSGTTGIVLISGPGIHGPLALFTACISIGVAAGLAMRLGNANLGIPLGMIYAFFIFALIFQVEVGVRSGVGGFIGVITAFVTAGTVTEHLRTGQRTRLGVILSAVISVNYLVMVGLFILGGWGILTRLAG